MPGRAHIKDPVSSFTYCPRCAVPLTVESYNHRLRKVCPTCRFVDFHNPAPAYFGSNPSCCGRWK